MNLLADPGHKAPKDSRILLVLNLHPLAARLPPEAPGQFGFLALGQRPRLDNLRADDPGALAV